VVVLERFGPAHHRGASHGGERIFCHAHEDPAYVRMALAADQAWTRLDHDTDRTLIHRSASSTTVTPPSWIGWPRRQPTAAS